MFCKTCGSILKHKDKNLVCDCGFSMPANNIKETISKPEPEVTGVLDTNNYLATDFHICKKCGHDKARLTTKGIFYGDEDECLQFVCGRCGFTEDVAGLRPK